MRIGINYKNGKKEVLNESDTKDVIKSVNYLKLIKFLLGSKSMSEKTIKILDKEVKTEELKSIEIIFM